MKSNRIRLFVLVILSIMILSSFYVLSYRPDNRGGNVIYTETSESQASNNLNGTFGGYFLDNFTKDSQLNSSLWVVNGKALSTAESNFPSDPANPPAAIVTPYLNFSSNRGMGMTGVNSTFEAGGIQSVSAFSHAFTAEASVYATVAHANPFTFGITNLNGTQGIAIMGNVNSTNQPYYGLQIASPEYSNYGWGWQPKPLLANPSLNQIYILSISMDLEGYATVGVGMNGIFGPSFTMYIGTGSYYLFLGQYVGYPNNGQGPNQAYWQWAGVSYSNASLSSYSVNFHVNGVASGFLWGVTLGNITKYTNTQCISIVVSRGQYYYGLAPVDGYIVSPISGTVSVNDSNVLIQVYYVKSDPSAPGATSIVGVEITGAVLGSIALVGAGSYMFLRRKKNP